MVAFTFFLVVVMVGVPVIIIVKTVTHIAGNKKRKPVIASRPVASLSAEKKTSTATLIGAALFMPFGLLFAPFKYFWDRRK